eukprot:m51a1_g6416 hypothetical protein (266) ;mRNA; f:291748-292774
MLLSFRTLGSTKLPVDIDVGVGWREAQGMSPAAVKISCSFPQLFVVEPFEELRCDACAGAPVVVVEPADCLWSERVERPQESGLEHYHYTARVSCVHGAASDVGDVVLVVSLAGLRVVSTPFRIASRKRGRPPGPEARQRNKQRAIVRVRSSRSEVALRPPDPLAGRCCSLVVKIVVGYSLGGQQHLVGAVEFVGGQLRALVPGFVGRRCEVIPAQGGEKGSIMVAVEVFSDPQSPSILQGLIQWHVSTGHIPAMLTLHESVTHL